jgi:hypothetical protein
MIVFAVMEEEKFSAFKYSVFMKIFGPEREEVTSDSRKLTDELLYDSFSSSCNIRTIKKKDEMGELCSKYEMKAKCT